MSGSKKAKRKSPTPVASPKGPSIRFVQYANKSRSGQYIQIKSTGNKTTILKYDDHVPIDIYIKGHIEKWPRKELQKHVRAWANPKASDKAIRDAYRRNLRASGKLSTKFSPGMTTARVNLSDLADAGTVRRLYEKLLKPLLLDKSMLPIVLQNREKLRHRFGYRLDIIGSDGKTEGNKSVGHVTDIGHRTLEELFGLYHTKLGYKHGVTLSQGRIPSDIALIGLPKGSGTQTSSSPTIDHVSVTITFQRG